MELVYSMRRAPLAIDPPYLESLNGGPTLLTLSNGNIAAFTSLTRLDERTGDSWGSHVYVCDINTPWDCCLVASYVQQVSALEWDAEGRCLLVCTADGQIEVRGSRDHLLNDWVCLHSVSLSGEHIIKATFFHNGRRLVMTDKKTDLCTERLQYTNIAPTVRGFGGAACEGFAVVTASGLLAASVLDERPTLASEALLTNRSHVACADIGYSNDGKLLVAVSGGGGQGCVRCYRVSVRYASGTTHVSVHPLAGFYLRDAGMSVRALRWWLREDTDTLLVAGAGAAGADAAVDAWSLADRALPVHARAAERGAKPTECFNTIEWKHAHRFRPGARVTALSSARGRAGAGAGGPHVAVCCADNTLHLLHHNLTRVCSMAVSAAGAVDAAGPSPSKIAKRSDVPSGVESAVVSACDLSRLGGVLLCIDSHSQLHLYTQRAPDIPTPLLVQQTGSLLEYALVGGYDYLDVLLALRPSAVEAVYERVTESFQRQPAAFQQFHYVSWLCLRAALSRLLADGQTRASELTSLLMLNSIASAFRSLLRPAELAAHDKGPAESLAALIQDEAASPTDIHKVLVVLEAKEFTAEPLALQSLRRLVQRVADTALAALAALPARHAAPRAPHDYALCTDASAINLLRELLVLSRVWGLLRQQTLPTFPRAPDGSDVLAALYRLLSRLASGPAGLDSVLDECAMLSSQVAVPRLWESPPRCCVAAPHGQPSPLYLEYCTEPEQLKYRPEPPPAGDDTAPDTDMDSVRYIHLGAHAARVRRCGRCGARALAAAHSARTHAQRAWDMRWLAACRCGGRWSIQVNT